MLHIRNLGAGVPDKIMSREAVKLCRTCSAKHNLLFGGGAWFKRMIASVWERSQNINMEEPEAVQRLL